MRIETLNVESCGVEARCVDRKRDEEWTMLYNSLVPALGETLASDIVEALKELYSIYTVDVVKWYANLFDPDIGGYYYSNSARDFDEASYNGVNYRLLPDLESTYQGDSFLYSSLVEG